MLGHAVCCRETDSRLFTPFMKVRITQNLAGSIDGIQLDHFKIGHVYDLGPSLGSVLVAEGWAEVVMQDEPAAPAHVDEIAEEWGRAPAKPTSATVHDKPRKPRK